ncbi:exodeoxyribonuclease III [Nakamurella aerolata]|uniref:Exodeoxyribonuclease III n=1 Tax=Nakamurella aerolata TaxID=1656892 RepID=A0A849A4N4_9ACTN|nr:exodeoxyribonuclease III [Nakamurella aerolata]
MLRVATFNVNGIRAAVRRGYLDWQQRTRPDVVCLQEVRAPAPAVPPEVHAGRHFSYHAGNRAGRNGVAILTRQPPLAVRRGFAELPARARRPTTLPPHEDPDDFDPQGRYLEVDLPGLTVASLYLPKGDVDGEKYLRKLRFLALLEQRIALMIRRSRRGNQYLLCGDFNIAPAEPDIRFWRKHRGSEGFLPAEREWINRQLAPGRLVDVLRTLRPDEVGPFTWWSWRSTTWAADAGWRIDHQLATPELARTATAAWVDTSATMAERMSDHSPMVADYTWVDPPT